MVLVSGSRFSSNGSPAIWLHHLRSDTGRAAPPVRADMIFGKDRPDDLCEVVDIDHVGNSPPYGPNRETEQPVPYED
jgi:hypothetical protein